MIARDTNMLARLLLRDAKKQHARVLRLLAGPQDFTASVSVMLELVWVLEVNGCSTADVVRGLNLLLGKALGRTGTEARRDSCYPACTRSQEA